MKKRFFAACAAVLFVGSTLNASEFAQNIDENNCAEIAYNLQQDLENEGVSKRKANQLANTVYEACEGANTIN